MTGRLFLFFVFLPALIFSQSGQDKKNFLEKARQEPDGAKALAFLQQASSLKPRDDNTEEAFYRMGQYYYAQGAYGSAVRMFDSLLLVFPAGYFKGEALFWKGLSLLSAGAKDSAQALLAKLPEDDPAVLVRGQVVLGVLLARDGKCAESSRCLEKALKLGDNALRSAAYYQLSRNYFALSDTAQALFYAKKLKDEFPGAIEAPQAEIDLTELLSGKGKTVATAPAAAPSREAFALQLGAFQSRENAEKVKKKYADTYGNTDIAETRRDSGILYVVRLGNFKNAKDAEQFATLELNLSAKDFKVIKR
jgi:tetratricopeptide (TPR) repeat protein